MIRVCEKCILTTTGNFCRGCGKGTIPYYLKCPHCEKDLSVFDKFCEKCGKPVQEQVRAFVDKERKEVDGKKISDMSHKRSGMIENVEE